MTLQAPHNHSYLIHTQSEEEKQRQRKRVQLLLKSGHHIHIHGLGRKEMNLFVAPSSLPTLTATTTHLFRERSLFCNRWHCIFRHFNSSDAHRATSLRVTSDSNSTELPPDSTSEKSEADKLVDGMNFGELCNEFECISSPSVEATARQLARDILELREGNRALGTFAVFVKYKDPIRSFTGRDKYKRPLWTTAALEEPVVSVQEMVMLSTSALRIKWTVKGRPKSIFFRIGGDVIVKVNSEFTLNQISGQVIEHVEYWDLSASSALAQAYFWGSRRVYATVEVGKDMADFVKDLSSRLSTNQENLEIYRDPSGDPTKFFQRDDNFQRDAYQIALFVAVVYLVVQFLRTTL